MPVTKYDKKYLLKLLDFKIDDKTLERNISNMGLSVESMDENQVEVEFQANRPDLISTMGLARAIRYFMRRSRSFSYKAEPAGPDDVINVGKHVGAIRPRIAALIVENMNLEDGDLLDIINFTEKLSTSYGRKREKIAMGLHDLRETEAPFFYDAYEDEEFVPLNRSKPMKYSDILKLEEKGKRYGKLGEAERRYVALKDMKGTMSIIPIINSNRTRVSTATKRMLVDITGRSKEIIENVADMLAADFIDRGYTVRRVTVSYGGAGTELPMMKSRKFIMPLGQLESEIGVVIGFNNIILLANKMGYEAALIGRKITLSVPTYRLDVINEQDIVEDIAVAYGYDYIQPAALPATQEGALEKKSIMMERISETMLGLGFAETINSYLTNEETAFKKMREREYEHYISIANPKSETATMLRTSLLPSLLKELGQSMSDKLPIRLFELDLVFGLNRGEPEEKYNLAAVACHAQANFNDMKSVLEGLAKKIGVKLEMRKAEQRSFIEGRCASITLDKRNIGFIGEVHPEVLTSFGIEEPVIGFEIDFGEWAGAKREPG